MTNNELIQKLKQNGWKSVPYTRTDEYDFYLYKIFDITNSFELPYYISYTDILPNDEEKIYVVYEIFPNRPYTQWAVWSEYDNQSDIIFYQDDFDTVLELALENKLFTYPYEVKQWKEI